MPLHFTIRVLSVFLVLCNSCGQFSVRCHQTICVSLLSGKHSSKNHQLLLAINFYMFGVAKSLDEFPALTPSNPKPNSKCFTSVMAASHYQNSSCWCLWRRHPAGVCVSASPHAPRREWRRHKGREVPTCAPKVQQLWPSLCTLLNNGCVKEPRTVAHKPEKREKIK